MFNRLLVEDMILNHVFQCTSELGRLHDVEMYIAIMRSRAISFHDKRGIVKKGYFQRNHKTNKNFRGSQKKKHVHIQYAQLTSRARPPMNTRLIISWPSGTVGAWKRQIISEMFYLSFYAVRTRSQLNSRRMRCNVIRVFHTTFNTSV